VRLLLLSSTFRGLPGLGPRHGPPVDGPSRAPAACFAAAGRVMGLSLFVENTGDAPELPDVLGSERAQVVQLPQRRGPDDELGADARRQIGRRPVLRALPLVSPFGWPFRRLAVASMGSLKAHTCLRCGAARRSLG